MNKNTDDYFEKLLSKLSKVEVDKNNASLIRKKIIEEKKEILLPMAQFLNKVRNVGLMVYPFETLLLSQTQKESVEPIQFKYFLEETSNNIKYDLVHPGPLIIINDPVKIEISVINETFRKKDGLIKISCGKNHPDFEMLSKNFDSIDEAISAISEFLAKNTVSINRH